MSNDRGGIFAGEDPFKLLHGWMELAWEKEPSDANAATLATVDAQGAPNARIVLIKETAGDALLFYTNYTSVKAAELDHAGKAALVFHWKSLRRQVRICGTVSRADGAQSDAYYNSRALGSRLGAWASPQSQPIADRDVLEDRLAEVTERFGDAPPRPEFWGGYRLVPDVFEFWAEGEHRLHNRFRWQRSAGGWQVDRLAP